MSVMLMFQVLEMLRAHVIVCEVAIAVVYNRRRGHTSAAPKVPAALLLSNASSETVDVISHRVNALSVSFCEALCWICLH